MSSFEGTHAVSPALDEPFQGPSYRGGDDLSGVRS